MPITATVCDIADAMLDALNGTVLSLDFTADRWYVPIRDLRDLTGLTLSVVPMTTAGTQLDRGGHYMDEYEVAIGIQQVIGQGMMTNAQIKTATDPLMAFAEQIVKLFRNYTLDRDPVAKCVGYVHDPIFAPQHVDEMRLYTSVITLKWKLGR